MKTLTERWPLWVGRALVLLGLLALAGGTKAFGIAGLLLGLGAVIHLLQRSLEENREFKALIVALTAKSEERHDA